MKIFGRIHRLGILAISTAVLTLSGCNKPVETAIDTQPASDPALTVITRISPTSYYEDKHGPEGMEFRLIEAFAKHHNYKLNVVVAAKEAEIHSALDQGLADIALLGQPLSLSRQNTYLQSPSYMDVTTQLVYKHGTGKPTSFEDLANKKVLVQDNEQYREKYRFLKAHYKHIDWTFTSDKTQDELLGLVNQGLIDYTLVDSHVFINKRSMYTRTRIAFDLYYPEPITLVYSPHSSEETRLALDSFFDAAREDGTLNNLIERFYGHADDVNPRGSMTFFRRIHTRLPHYQELIEQIAGEYELDWRLLAAIAYQESHWDPHAKSPTGVRGMMMLTQGTAKEMGVTNRLDTVQSLRGGAKYFKNIYRRLPETIQEPDRTWFTLAAYNVGLGHVRDVREITEFQGGNPDSWADIQKHLPLLEKKMWYQYTRYGRARGNEAVSYVQHIRYYNDLLEWRFPDKQAAPQQEIQQAKKRSEIKIKPLKEAIKEARAKEALEQPLNVETTPKQPTPLSSLKMRLSALL